MTEVEIGSSIVTTIPAASMRLESAPPARSISMRLVTYIESVSVYAPSAIWRRLRSALPPVAE